MRIQLLCILLWLAGARAGLSAEPSRLHFAAAGFSILPLEAPVPGMPQQVLLMALPATEGFAPNVNVQVQPFTGTLDEYIELSLQQFKEAELKVIGQKKQGTSVALFEYAGPLQGRPLHWYARAVQATGTIYLVTATATETQWPSQAASLKACVDSFRPEKRDPGADSLKETKSSEAPRESGADPRP